MCVFVHVGVGACGYVHFCVFACMCVCVCMCASMAFMHSNLSDPNPESLLQEEVIHTLTSFCKLFHQTHRHLLTDPCLQ